MSNIQEPTIVCVGSTMVDLISYLERMPAQGETIFGRGFAQGFGGKGANQAVMAALLGGDVTMVNTVATDSFGRDTIENFKSFGVDVSFMEQVDNSYSGVANVLVDTDGDNRIILGAGANELMTVEQVDRAFSGKLHVDLVLSQLEVPQEIIQRGFEHAKQLGSITVLNPGPASPVAREILELTDWLIPNETEFELLYKAEYGRTPRDYTNSAAEFSKRLNVNVVVTLGGGGATLIEGSTIESFPAPVVDVVDTTGAGDAFCGAFSYAIADGAQPADAIRLAVSVASDSVQRRGTQLSYARGAELDELIGR